LRNTNQIILKYNVGFNTKSSSGAGYSPVPSNNATYVHMELHGSFIFNSTAANKLADILANQSDDLLKFLVVVKLSLSGQQRVPEESHHKIQYLPRTFNIVKIIFHYL
jgi:hypothetical protein